jgi:signal peptidase I
VAGLPGEALSRRSNRAVIETALLVITAVVIAVLLRAFVAQAFRIPSASMEPQLLVGDRVVVSRLAYDLHAPRRGDIVVFDCPPRAGCAPVEEHSMPVRALQTLAEALLLRQPEVEEFIKRVIALPGETVEAHDGAVYVNGRRLIEPYLPAGTSIGDFEPVKVPDGHLWVMGDNRTNSSDSRVFGPIDADTIVGRAILRVWPPQRTAFL